MQLIDSHCHFDFEAFDNDRVSLWQHAQKIGITALLIPGVSPQQWSKADTICQQLQGIAMAAGLHPWWLAGWQQAMTSTTSNPFSRVALQQLRNAITTQASQAHCVAIGECGLDGFIDTPMEHQLAVFEMHIDLACELQLPLIIHNRKTHHQTLALLKRYQPPCGGVIHGFSGSREVAQRYWQLGFYLGVGGTITYPRAVKTRKAIVALPLEALLLETDAPDMPISGRQGQANSPVFLPEIAGCLAQLTGIKRDAIARQTSANCRSLFRQWRI